MSETYIEAARRRREESEANTPHKLRRTWCNACGDGKDRLVVGVMPVGADETTLECRACGARDSGTADPQEPGGPPVEAHAHDGSVPPGGDVYTAEEIESVAADLNALELDELRQRELERRRDAFTLVPMPED